MARNRTKFVGVYTRESASRKYDGKPDICFEVTFKDRFNKKIWHKVGWRSEGYTAAMAHEIRSEMMRKGRHGEMLPGSKGEKPCLTLAEAWGIYHDRHLPCTKGRSAQSAISLYTTHLHRFARKRLNDISVDDMETLKASLFTKGRTPQTVRNVLSLLRAIYHRVTEWGLYNGPSPLLGVRMPKVDNQRLRFLSEQEASTLLREIRQRSEQTYHICLLSLHTGMRMGEIFALRGEHIDLDSLIIHAMDAKAGTRPVQMTQTVRAMLQEILPARRDSLLFPARGGGVKKQLGDTFDRAVAAVKLNEGITDFRLKVVPHTLRHSYASWLAKKSVPMYVIAELMGHSTLEMTRRYAKLAPDQKREAVALLDDMLIADHES